MSRNNNRKNGKPSRFRPNRTNGQVTEDERLLHRPTQPLPFHGGVGDGKRVGQATLEHGGAPLQGMRRILAVGGCEPRTGVHHHGRPTETPTPEPAIILAADRLELSKCLSAARRIGTGRQHDPNRKRNANPRRAQAPQRAVRALRVRAGRSPPPMGTIGRHRRAVTVRVSPA